MDSSSVRIDLTVPTETQYLRLVGTIGEGIANELEDYNGNRETLAYDLNLVLTEAVTNAIVHTATETSENTVRVGIELREGQLYIRVIDHGQGFDLDAIPAPDLDNPSEGGYGLFFIRTLMDSVEYRKIKGGNLLEMRKQLN